MHARQARLTKSGATRGLRFKSSSDQKSELFPVKNRHSRASRLPDCIQHRVGPDGQRLYRVRIRRDGVPPYSKQFDSLEQAMSARDAHLGLIQNMKVAGLNTAVTVRDAIEDYQRGFRYLQLRSKGRGAHFEYWLERLGDKRLVSLTLPVLALERDRLMRKHRTGSTVCVYLSALSQAWEWAKEKLGAVPNTVRQIQWPSRRVPPPRKYSSPQLRTLLERADGYVLWRPLALLVRLSLITTQRRGTMLEVLWRQVDLEEGTIEVLRTKNGAPISLPVEGQTLELLRAHHASELAAERGKQHHYVFQSPTLVQPMEVKKHLDWLFDCEELGGLTFKHLRSTSLSRLFTHAKLDLPRVMAISGHKTARVLLEHYAHADDDEKRKAIREHERMLLGG